VTDSSRQENPDLSVVIPIYNEEENIRPLLADLVPVLGKLGRSWECLFVDDGSTDSSAELLRNISLEDRRIKVLELPGNQGQGTALYHGLQQASGDYIVTLDGDRQNVPDDIPKLFELMDSADLVVGIRQNRRDSILRRWMSRIANRVRSRLLGDGVQDSGCALKVFRKEVVGALIPIQTLYSFVPALAAGGGYRVSEVPVQHRERDAGTSNYGLGKMLWRPLVDMMGVLWYNQRRADAITNKAPLSEGNWTGTKWLTIIGIVIAYFAFAGNHGLLEPDEGRYAEIPREMLASGEFLTPTLNGIPHVQKPPLLYWTTALSYQLFGVSEWTARLPSILSALGTLGCAGWIAYCLGGVRLAGLTTLTLASSLEFFLLARTLTPDMLMTFWITASIAALITSTRHSSPWFGWLFFIFMGFGFLTKGPLAILVPCCAAIGLHFAKRYDQAFAIKVPWLWGTVLMLSIAFSWFIAISAFHPELFHYFVQYELLDRFASSTHGRSQPVWFFVPILAAGFMPWTFLAPGGAFCVYYAIKNKVRLPETIVLLSWAVPPFIVLSFSGSKLLTYVLPLFPALAILMGMALLRVGMLSKAPLLIMSGLTASVAVGAIISSTVAPAAYQLGVSAIVPIILLLSSLSFMWGVFNLKRYGIGIFAVTSLLCWVAIASQISKANPLLERQASVKELAATLCLQPEWAESTIISSNIRAHGFEFYLGRTVDATESQSDIVLPLPPSERVRMHSSPRAVAELRAKNAPIYVLTRERDYWKFFHDNSPWVRVDQAGAFVLLKQPAGLLTGSQLSADHRSQPLDSLVSSNYLTTRTSESDTRD
jgi:4-amino-4-deoxy-L-arabinose transferase-like glycosyltransferase/glycosyltransferase involved in cell wall biosynthesis